MIGTDEILTKLHAMLDAKKIKRADIARALKLGPSRITEILDGRRKLKLDEAEVLVETFGLEEPQFNVPTATPILQLAVRHVAQELGCDEQLLAQRSDDLVQDLAAFFRYAANPQVRENIALAEGFFLARDAMGSGPLAANS